MATSRYTCVGTMVGTARIVVDSVVDSVSLHVMYHILFVDSVLRVTSLYQTHTRDPVLLLLLRKGVLLEHTQIHPGDHVIGRWALCSRLCWLVHTSFFVFTRKAAFTHHHRVLQS